jgi:alpha-1,6-mannosyl-glycoprotein beta-1,2-N-acetylglucosaminyltransferase
MLRPTPRKVVKSVLILVLFGFIFTNMNLFLQPIEGEDGGDTERHPGGAGAGGGGGALHPPMVLTAKQFAVKNGSKPNAVTNSSNDIPPHTNASQEKVDKNKSNHNNNDDNNVIGDINQNKGKSPRQNTGDRTLLGLPHNPSGPNATLIEDFIEKINREQKVHNLERFDLRGGSETVVVVVQVHNRVEYLKHLIDSLRKARNIENVLLIFSHDYYMPAINDLVKEIDFCPMLQIFYPFPMQIYQKEFPGEHPNDCPRDVKKAEALKRGCNNAEHPDKYGHYREAKYTQTKHHWNWKINHVFDHLTVMQHHTGPVLFIEEDHYLVDDFIPVLRQMVKLSQETCKECSIMTLGTYDKNPTYVTNSGKVEITDWVSNKHNMGMALNRSVWNKIKGCKEAFCRFDDYNWDWSLQFISLTCIKGRLKVMLSKSPRIFHIGECGVHHKGKNCNPAEKVKQIEGLLERNRKYLFPDRLTILGYPRSLARIPKPNGGWGDLRDREMCIKFSQDITHR